VTTLVRVLLISVMVSLLAACSIEKHRQPAPVVSIIDKGTDGSISSNKSTSKASPVIKHLLQQARQLKLNGQAPRAAAVLERAIRIEPQNPFAWHQLAQVRMDQKNYSQAESLALRSNRYAYQNKVLQKANWLLIARVRELKGLKKAAERARKKADSLP